ncbi:NPCBM/NEW2 domain-containing protein [Streptomyces sp. B6B3]|uniref:NPCBM/NEW2 domain-containing protein n=1 Tax=Streptomyces sp. B6B3 TaxID=3153570 RepID=UPI00325C6614
MGVAAPAASATPTDVAPDAVAAPPGDNLALTPPMGFNNWNSTHCRPEFNEEMVRGIADLFVESGLKDAGYEYVNLDDCWALPERDENGKLVPDPERFPSGLDALGDYIHSKGLKFGIYTSAGTKTCNPAGFPGALGHEVSDAQQFADWGVDYLKYDNCNNQGVDAVERYTAMRDALAATGRDIVYSICEWGQNQPWTWAQDVGHLWRTTGDITDTWDSVMSIFKRNVELAEYAGPGHWNDPDMLEVGNGGMTDTEYRSHFSLWAMMAAPLLIGSDLRVASEETFDILGNTEVIAVDQDPLGRQGTVVSSENGAWVLSKEMADGSRAVALFNESDTAQHVGTTAEAVGLPAADAYEMRDLWEHESYQTAGTISATVPAHGIEVFRVSPDGDWAQYPSAVEVGASAVQSEAGTTAELTTAVTNLGRTPAKSVSVDVAGPEGWTIEAGSATTSPALATDAALTTDWTVEIPPGTPGGSYDLTVTADYRSPRHQPRQDSLTVEAQVLVPPGEGTSYVSDLAFVREANGQGPVERDTNVGSVAAGDGTPITIEGTVFDKGLGTHAPSTVEIYTAGRCDVFSAQVGIDDAAGAGGGPPQRGSVTFEVWADGTRVAATGVLNGTAPAQPLTADVSGASFVELVVTDGGNGKNSDHADWADATVSCTA